MTLPGILVTGSNGQLGNEIRRLTEKLPNARWIFTDVAELDITSPQAIHAFTEQNDIQWIINCAAYTAVDKAETEREIAWSINAAAPGYLAEAALKKHIPLIHISTDYVFDGRGYRPYSHEAIPAPESWYGKTKLGGEEAIRASGAKAWVIRTSWLYSVFGNNFVKTIRRLGQERESLGIVADQTGSPTWAADLASLLIHIIQNELRPEGYQILHYSNEGICSWYDFACEILNISGISCRVNPIRTEQYPLPAPRPFYSVMDKSYSRERMGIEIPHWTESLKKCIALLDE